MAWARRGKSNFYFYQSARVGGRVIKRYLGRGTRARLAADEIQRTKARRLTDQAALSAELARTERAQAAIVELDTLCRTYLEAILLAHGYHRHNYGPWRRRRGITES